VVYSARVPYTYTSATGVATVHDPSATLTWNVQTVTGFTYTTAKVIKVTVTAQSGDQLIYTVSVKRDPSPINTLSGLSIDVAISLTPTFSPTTTSYTAIIPTSETSASAEVALTDPRSTIEWVRSSVDGIGPGVEKNIELYVISESGVSRKYAIIVKQDNSLCEGSASTYIHITHTHTHTHTHSVTSAA